MRFAEAPYVHPFNAPKYHASQLRAEHYARRKNIILLWLVAEDKPLHKDHHSLSPEELKAKRDQWLTYHDQQTGGIMGLQPLALGMPLRITQTILQHKDKRLFKNARCTLHGWKLHPVDEERLRHTAEQQLVLQHMPEQLFIRMEAATWVAHSELGPGVVGLKPVTTTWAIDKQ